MLKALTVVGLARVVSTACQAVTLLLVARQLSPPVFAEFAAVLGGLMALGIVADGGATYAVSRHHESRSTAGHILRAGRLLSIGTMAVSLPVLGTFAAVTGSSILLACLPLCLWVPFERQLEVNSAYLLARGRDALVGAGYLLRRVPTLVMVLVLPSSHVVAAFSVTMLATSVGAHLLLARRVAAEVSGPGRPAGSRTAGLRGRLLPPGGTWAMLRPFWAAMAGQGARQVDVAVLTLAAGPVTAGLFAPASRLVPALLLVPGTYTQMLLARLASTKEDLAVRLLLVVGAVSTVAFVPVAMSAGIWVPLLLGEAYAGSVDVVRIVTMSLVFATMSSVFASGLHVADRASLVAASVWLSVVVTVVLVAVLGAARGPVGAGSAVASGYLLQFVLMATCYRFRHVGTSTNPNERSPGDDAGQGPDRRPLPDGEAEVVAEAPTAGGESDGARLLPAGLPDGAGERGR